MKLINYRSIMLLLIISRTKKWNPIGVQMRHEMRQNTTEENIIILNHVKTINIQYLKKGILVQINNRLFGSTSNR